MSQGGRRELLGHGSFFRAVVDGHLVFQKLSHFCLLPPELVVRQDMTLNPFHDACMKSRALPMVARAFFLPPLSKYGSG